MPKLLCTLGIIITNNYTKHKGTVIEIIYAFVFLLYNFIAEMRGFYNAITYNKRS